MSDTAFPENTRVRDAYEAALGPRRFADPDRTHVVMGVYTTDLTEGRGDVYVAVGLGRRLVEHGYEIVYLGRDDWYDPPDDTDVFISMLAEPSVMLDPLGLDPSIRRIAWARNNTDRWAASEHLAVYDAVLCSSRISEQTISRTYPGPTAILRIGFDADLFAPGDAGAGAHPGDVTDVGEAPPPGRTLDERRGVVSTVNQWGGERQVFGALKQLDIDFPLALYGTQRGLAPELEAHARDPVSFFALPSVYRAAELVLDDQQDVNRGFGNVNSRIYESLACGALPITNTRLGLDDVGLAAVPAYATPGQLDRSIRELLDRGSGAAHDAAQSDASDRAQLVTEMRDTVLARHTYTARARQLHDHITELGPANHRVVAFFPDYRATNPYQSMLYDRGPDNGVASCPADSGEDIATLSALLGERLVAHVHWTATVLGPADDRADAQRRAAAFLDTVDGVRRRGGRVVWTVHNVAPHDGDFPEVENGLRQDLAEAADAVHVMCEQTVDLVADHYRLPEESTHVIAHASYVDIYPNLVDRAGARRELGIEGDATVLAFVGQVRAYKGIVDLVDAVGTLRRQRPDVRALIAGNPGKAPGTGAIVDRLESDPTVDARLRIIDDAELQIFLNAADIVVLPYREALNSGALQLALSFGRPVVSANVGCLPASLEHDTGVIYDDDLVGALDTAIERFTGPDRTATERACYEAARAHDYLDMSQQYMNLVRSLDEDSANWRSEDVRTGEHPEGPGNRRLKIADDRSLEGPDDFAAT